MYAKGRLYHVFKGWEHKGRGSRWVVALTNQICHKGLSKEVNVGDWALSGLPCFRVLDTAFVVRSPLGLWAEI